MGLLGLSREQQLSLPNATMVQILQDAFEDVFDVTRYQA